MTSTDPVRHSIIIPSYNSERSIVACLEALVSQVEGRAIEIIVVDSSEDATPEKISERFPEVTLIHSETRLSAGEARNLGIERASGDVLLFIDSDCVACPDWVARLQEAHRSGDFASVGGCVINGNPESLISWAGYFLEFSKFFPRAETQEPVNHIPTCNISYRRSLFEKNGPFPVDLYPVEDRAFNEKLVKAGDRILFDSKIEVRHFHRSSFRGFLRHQAKIGWGSAFMRKQRQFGSSFIAKSAWLLPLFLPPMLCLRVALLLKRLLCQRPGLLLFWLACLPFYLLGLIAWIVGFSREVARGSEEKRLP